MARRISLVDISSKRRRVRRLLFWGGILLALGLIVVGMLWVVVRSNVFKIQSIEIVGTTYVSPDSVRDFLNMNVAMGPVSKYLGSENIFSWPGEFKEEDLSDLPALSLLRIEKNYLSRSIKAEVVERERAGLWCFVSDGPRQCFWFDPGGNLFMPGYFAEGNLTPLLDDYSREPLALGDKVLSARSMPNLISIFAALNSIDLSIREIRLDDFGKEEVEARTYNGLRLFFSLRFPAAGVPDAISAVRKVTPLSGLEYIDFRVENKVYYK